MHYLLRLNIILLSVLIPSLIIMVASECNQTRFEEICNNELNWNLSKFSMIHTDTCVNENYNFVL